MPEIVWNGKWHPYAERFRMRSEPDIRALAEDIEQNGQAAPCVMTKDGLGLDGRNRVAACRIAGIEPEWIVYEGSNPVARIMSLNLGSRDYSTGQKAMMTAIGLKEQGKQKDDGTWEHGSVAASIPDDLTESGKIKTWRQRVAEAGVVLIHLPDSADQVISGETALSNAYDEACKKRDENKEQAELLANLPADLAALVDNGVRDLKDAAQEAADRAKVTGIDAIRDADEAPPPSFAESVEAGMVSWSDAAKLAEEWLEQRGEAIKRAQDRLRGIVSAWGAIWEITTNPNTPYVSDILSGLSEEDQAKVQDILSSIKNGDQQ